MHGPISGPIILSIQILARFARTNMGPQSTRRDKDFALLGSTLRSPVTGILHILVFDRNRAKWARNRGAPTSLQTLPEDLASTDIL